MTSPAAPADHRYLERFLWLSLATAVVTVALKAAAALITNSVGMWSDALESTVNLLADMDAQPASLQAARPPSITVTSAKPASANLAAAACARLPLAQRV